MRCQFSVQQAGIEEFISWSSMTLSHKIIICLCHCLDPFLIDHHRPKKKEPRDDPVWIRRWAELVHKVKAQSKTPPSTDLRMKGSQSS